LLEDVTRGIEIVVKKEPNWSKDLSGMPMFTIREFDEHRIKSGKKRENYNKSHQRQGNYRRKIRDKRYNLC